MFMNQFIVEFDFQNSELFTYYLSPKTIYENLFIILVPKSSTLSYRENSLDCPGCGPDQL